MNYDKEKEIKMMKILFYILCFIPFLSGCFTYNGKFYSILPIDHFETGWLDVSVTNSYYESIYFKGDSIKERLSIYKESQEDNIIYSKQGVISFCSGKCAVDEQDETISFYQDKEMKCYLFSYTLAELTKIRRSVSPRFIFSHNDDNTFTYVIGENGVSAISLSEYERLKPTFKPHPYDPSLCNTNPNE